MEARFTARRACSSRHSWRHHPSHRSSHHSRHSFVRSKTIDDSDGSVVDPFARAIDVGAFEDVEFVPYDPALRLILMRHGKSSWANEEASDKSRGLARQGEVKAANAARALTRRGWTPALILSSDAARCLATLEAMSSAEPELKKIDVRIVPEFYDVTHGDEASGKKSMKAIKRVVQRATSDATPANAGNAQTILCIGHNYGFEKAASRLTGKKVTLKTGDAALLTFTKKAGKKGKANGAAWSEAFAEGAWTLEDVLSMPKESEKVEDALAEEDEEDEETYDGVEDGKPMLSKFINELKLSELQEECRSQSLDDTGAVSALRARLLENMAKTT